MSLLSQPDPNWPKQAKAEIARWRTALGPALQDMHHIGSTSVPDLIAKPVLDLLPVFASETALDAAKPAVEALGYEWLGEFGLPGRRYCRQDNPTSGQRMVQAHAYATGSPEIRRHLAFRDWLRAAPANAKSYAAEKQRAAHLYPKGGPDYQDCKSDWINAAETQALRDDA